MLVEKNYMAKSSSKTQKTSSKSKDASPSKLSSSELQDDFSSSELSDEMATPSSDQVDTGLDDLLLDSVKDIYWAENHLVKNLPKMIKAAGSADLQNAFTDHLEITKTHVARLEEVFELLGEKRQAKKCDAMEGLSIEGEGVIESTIAGTPARDAGLIMAAQKVEHYEIASYGGLAALATKLGNTQAADIFNTTLAEEQDADALLTSIAESM